MTRQLRWLCAGAISVVVAALLAAPASASLARSITLSAPTTALTGRLITVGGTLSRSPIGTLIIIRRRSGSSWVQVAATRTATASGVYHHQIAVPSVRGTFYYDAYAPATRSLSTAISTTRAIAVRTRVTISLSVSNSSPLDGAAVTLAGTIRPWVVGTSITLQKRVGSASAWSGVALLAPNSTGRFNRRVVPTRDVPTQYRVLAGARGYYTSAVSPTVAVEPYAAVPTVTGFTAAPESPGINVDLSWLPIPGTDPSNATNPANAQTLIIRRSQGAVAPASPTSGSAVATLAATETYFLDSSALARATTYSYAIFLKDLAGHVSRGASATVLSPDPPAGLSWDPVTEPVVPAGSARFLQCPTSTFCMLAGYQSYQTWTAGTWSSPLPLPYQMDAPAAFLSCTSPTFCMLVDWQSYAIYNGQSWGPQISVVSTLPGTVFNSVACTSATFCMATAHDGVSVQWNGSDWTLGPRYGTAGGSYGDSVFCAAANLCWAGIGPQWDGTSWSNLDTGNGTTGNDSMSCVSTTFCMYVDFEGEMSEFTGHSWMAIASPWPATNGGATYADVACASPTFCVSVAQTQDTYQTALVSTFNGSAWTTPTPLHSGQGNYPLVACPSALSCMEVDNYDNHGDEEVTTYANGSWTSPTSVTQGNRLTTASCVRGGTCHVLEYAGSVRTYNGSAWSAPTLADPASGALDIACATESFCGIVDDGGGAVVEIGGVWGPRELVLPPGLGFYSISCTADNACMALTDNGVVAQYKNGSWTTTTPNTGTNVVEGGVGCGSANYCLDGDGHWWNGSTWTAIPGGGGAGGVSCVTSTDCVVAWGRSWQAHAVHVINGVRQGAPVPISAPIYVQNGIDSLSIGCASGAICASVVEGELNTFGPGGVTPGPVLLFGDWPNSVSCASANLCVALVNGLVSVGR